MNQAINTNQSYFEPCVCSHQPETHDNDGCMVCAAAGKFCSSYWSRTEYEKSVQEGLGIIAKTEREKSEGKTA